MQVKTFHLRAPFSAAEYYLARSAVYRILFSAALFFCAIRLLKHAQSAHIKVAAVVFLAFSSVFQAGFYAREQLAGPHTREQWPPFKSPTRVFAAAGQFAGPSQGALLSFYERLETPDFRTSVVCPPQVVGIFCSPHIGHFWNLRMIEGYLYSVPGRMVALPWPKEALGLRSLGFTDERNLPWGLLALFNVKYAVVLNAELMTNFVPLPSGSHREAMPGDIKILQNPHKVAPRVFFARSIVGVKGVEAAVAKLFSSNSLDAAPDPVSLSVVEGVTEHKNFDVETSALRLRARFSGDAAEIRFTPEARERFLVVNERFNAGWIAYAGGRQLIIHPTNVLMAGVVVPEGVDAVEFRYAPPTRSTAAYVCYLVATMLAAFFAMLLFRLGRFHSYPTPDQK
jgi:hypothetical protein